MGDDARTAPARTGRPALPPGPRAALVRRFAVDAGSTAICSASAAVDALLVVQNGCAESVDLWSITDPATCPSCCAEVFDRTIAPGTSSVQPSLVGRSWRLRKIDAGPVLEEILPLEPGTTTAHVP